MSRRKIQNTSDSQIQANSIMIMLIGKNNYLTSAVRGNHCSIFIEIILLSLGIWIIFIIHMKFSSSLTIRKWNFIISIIIKTIIQIMKFLLKNENINIASKDGRTKEINGTCGITHNCEKQLANLLKASPHIWCTLTTTHFR